MKFNNGQNYLTVVEIRTVVTFGSMITAEGMRDVSVVMTVLYILISMVVT